MGELSGVEAVWLGRWTFISRLMLSVGEGKLRIFARAQSISVSEAATCFDGGRAQGGFYTDATAAHFLTVSVLQATLGL